MVKAPHDNCWTELRPSAIHGVGVFARIDIPEDTELWPDDTVNIRYLSQDYVARLDEPTRKLYHDFAVLEDGEWACPSSFNDMTMAWYLNHSTTPNCIPLNGLGFWTARDIKQGEELTVDYTSYSDQGVVFNG